MSIFVPVSSFHFVLPAFCLADLESKSVMQSAVLRAFVHLRIWVSRGSHFFINIHWRVQCTCHTHKPEDQKGSSVDKQGNNKFCPRSTLNLFCPSTGQVLTRVVQSAAYAPLTDRCIVSRGNDHCFDLLLQLF